MQVRVSEWSTVTTPRTREQIGLLPGCSPSSHAVDAVSGGLPVTSKIEGCQGTTAVMADLREDRSRTAN